MNATKWRFITLAAAAVLLLALGAPVRTSAQVTRIDSANCNYWDVYDSFSSYDEGYIGDGGQDAFDDYGYLQIRVLDQFGTTIVDDEELCGFGLTWDEGRRWTSQTPVEAGFSNCSGGPYFASFEDGKSKAFRPRRPHRPYAVAPTSGIMVTRDLYSPLGTDYMRYIDTFQNTSGAVRDVYLAWGGDLGSDSCTTIAGSSSGDYSITNADQWAVTIEECGSEPVVARTENFDPNGPATDPPVACAFRGAGDTTFTTTGNVYDNPFETAWGGNGDDGLAYVFHFTMQPGQTVRLAYFLYRGMEEDTEPPVCGGGGGDAPAAIVPAGSEILKAKNWAAAMVANPDFGDLTPDVRASILNWPGSAYGKSFYDDTARAQFCVDFKTGNYQWNILKGAGMGTSFTGVATVFNGGAKVANKPGDPKVVNFTYDILRHKAQGYFITPAKIYSALVDKNTLDDPAGCAAPPPPPTKPTRE
jgi:hypothetical protein